MTKIDLSGNWKLRLDPNKAGINEKYFEAIEFSDTIILPGSVSQQKKSSPSQEDTQSYLVDPYRYEGWAWYKKEVDISSAAEKNFRLTLECTKDSSLWINGKTVGSKKSWAGPHIFDFSVPEEDLQKPLSVVLMISNSSGVTTEPLDRQTNWNGIVGELSLQELPPSRLENTRVNASASGLKITTELTGTNQMECRFQIENLLDKTETLRPGKNEIIFSDIKNQLPWSDAKPNTYDLQISNQFQNLSYKIGFRDFKNIDGHFNINGKNIFLRGKYDRMIFPQTGFPSTSVEDWKKILLTAKQYGINHYGFHNCCPPEAAFLAADELGIFISVGIPSTMEEPEQDFAKLKERIISEGKNIIDAFGNHPSFVMMNIEATPKMQTPDLDETILALRNHDSHRLYSSGSIQTTSDDYFLGDKISKDTYLRGSYVADGRTQGFVQLQKPNSSNNFDNCIKTERNNLLKNKPCVSNRLGQYYMYPDYSNPKKFTGVLQPNCPAEINDNAEDFFRDSSRLAMQSYKMEIEAALKSNELAGFQLLDIQDSCSSIGILDSFMESKGIVASEQWKSFCSRTVLLADFKKFIWQGNEEFESEIILHNYSETDYSGQYMYAYIINTEDNEILYEENFEIKNQKNFKGNLSLGTYRFKFDNADKYQKLCLLLLLNPENENAKVIINSYTLHVYPTADSKITEALKKLQLQESVEFNGTILTKNKNTKSSNKRVIYFPASFENQQTVQGVYAPAFLNYNNSTGNTNLEQTLGLSIKADSPLLKEFPTDTYSTPKWFNIVSHATCVKIENAETVPVIQMIDSPNRNWKLGLLYEDDDKIICTSRLWEIADEPEVNLFVKSLTRRYD